MLVYMSTVSSAVSVTAATAASGLLHCSSSFTCLLLCFPKWRAEGRVISLDLVLAPPPWLIHTICGMSGHINLYHNHLSCWSASLTFTVRLLLSVCFFATCILNVLVCMPLWFSEFLPTGGSFMSLNTQKRFICCACFTVAAMKQIMDAAQPRLSKHF